MLSSIGTDVRNGLAYAIIAVLTDMPERLREWRETIEAVWQQMEQGGDEGSEAVDYLAAIMALLDGDEATLPADHPYVEDLRAIRNGVG